MSMLHQPAALALKVVLAVGLLILAAVSFREARLAFLRTSDPAFALSLRPGDAVALEREWSARLGGAAAFDPSPSEMAAVRAALAGRPLSPILVALLGGAHELRGRKGEALSAMNLADRISRRNPIAGLWLIEASSGAGDVEAAVRHYHAVLSVQPDLQGALLPVLASAIQYPEVRAQVRRYLERPAPWAGPFLTLAGREAPLEHLNALLLPLPAALSGEAYAPALAVIMQRLAEAGRGEELRRLASAAVPGFSAAQLSDLGFSVETFDPRLGPLSWVLPSGEGVRAEWGGGEVIRIDAEPLSRGLAAVRDVPVDGGRAYEFAQRLEAGPGGVALDLAWSADCVRPVGLDRFWNLKIPQGSAFGVRRAVIIVPAGCNLVRLSLSAIGPDGQFPAAAEVGPLSLRRVP